MSQFQLPLPDLMTVPEVAEALRISDETVHRWARNGQLEFVEINGLKRFHRVYIESLVAARDDATARAGSSPADRPGS